MGHPVDIAFLSYMYMIWNTLLSSAAGVEDDPADAEDFNPFVLRDVVDDVDEGDQEQAEVRDSYDLVAGNGHQARLYKYFGSPNQIQNQIWLVLLVLQRYDTTMRN